MKEDYRFSDVEHRGVYRAIHERRDVRSKFRPDARSRVSVTAERQVRIDGWAGHLGHRWGNRCGNRSI